MFQTEFETFPNVTNLLEQLFVFFEKLSSILFTLWLERVYVCLLF